VQLQHLLTIFLPIMTAPRGTFAGLVVDVAKLGMLVRLRAPADGAMTGS